METDSTPKANEPPPSPDGNCAKLRGDNLPYWKKVGVFTVIGIITGIFVGYDKVNWDATMAITSADSRGATSHAANLATQIIGTWLCPNEDGFVSKETYHPKGKYVLYVTGYVPGYSNDTIEYVGTWHLDGNILVSGKYGYKRKIEILGEDRLLKTLQGSTWTQRCTRDF
jgi:hypothetical protein